MSRIDWSTQQSPGLPELDAMAQAAYRRLPPRFRALTRDVLIRVEDLPTDDVLDSLGIDSPFDLLGRVLAESGPGGECVQTLREQRLRVDAV